MRIRNGGGIGYRTGQRTRKDRRRGGTTDKIEGEEEKGRVRQERGGVRKEEKRRKEESQV